MTTSRFERLQRVFAEATELPETARKAFVQAACSGDPQLLREVEAMLAAAPLPSRHLLDAVPAIALAPAPAAIVPRSPTRPESYVVERELGRGGMGRVYLVRDRELPRHLALKVATARGMDASRVRDRFLAEARIMATLSHPGVVPVHELGYDAEGQPFFTMRCVAGSTARQVFAKARSAMDGWTLTRAIDVLLKVCDTMAYVHEQGVVHRDLKTDNVMVGEFGEVYVMDWGVAKELGDDDTATAGTWPPDAGHLTGEGDVLGTPYFMPPEQAAGRHASLDARADVYAAGCMLYELLAGVAPYGDAPAPRTGAAILAAVHAGPPTPVERLAHDARPELVAICGKAMARQPADRYASMSALGADLRAFVEQRVVQAYERGAVARLRKWVVRNRGLTATLAALLLLAIGAAIVIVWQRDRALRRDVARTHVLAARLALRSGSWRTALAAVESARAAGETDHVDLALDAVEAHLGLLELGAARQQLAMLAARGDLGTRWGRVLLLQGHATPERVGSGDRARHLFQRALEHELDPADAACTRGVLAADSAEALGCFAAALQHRPFHVAAFQRHLATLLSLGRWSEAEEQLRMARLFSPRDPLAAAAGVIVHLARGQFDAARAAIPDVAAFVGEHIRSPLAATIDRAERLAAIPAERASDAFEDWAPEITGTWTDPIGDDLPVFAPACYAVKEAYEDAIAFVEGPLPQVFPISTLVIDAVRAREMVEQALRRHDESGVRLLLGIALVNQPLAAGEQQLDKIRRCLPVFESGMVSATTLYGVRGLCRHLFLRCAHDLALSGDADAKARLVRHAAGFAIEDLQWPEVALFARALHKVGERAVPVELILRWLRLHPEDDDARAELARYWTLAGAPERGMAVAQEVLRRAAGHAVAAEQLAFAQAEWKKLAERAGALPAGK